MKKIITAAVLMVFSTFSAKAIDLGAFSVTGGYAENSSVWGASAKERNFDESGVVRTTKNTHGVFAESYSSYLLEMGIGRFLSIGYETSPDSIKTPTNTSNEGNASENNVSVAFEDFTTTYAKLNIPGGMYLKYGHVGVDVNITETGSSNKYSNKTTDGTSMGAGYQRFFGESGFGFRFEANYVELDAVSTDNGVTTASETNGGQNKIDTKNLEGATAKMALTYTFGRNN